MKAKHGFQVILDRFYHFNRRSFAKSVVNFHKKTFDWNTGMGTCNLLAFIIGAYMGIVITFAVSIQYLDRIIAVVFTVLLIPICGWAMTLAWWLFAAIIVTIATRFTWRN